MNNIISKIIKNKSIFIFFLSFFILITCKKPVPFGLNLYQIENSISYQRGVIKLINENLYVKYIITNYDDQNNNLNDDIIFFFMELAEMNFNG